MISRLQTRVAVAYTTISLVYSLASHAQAVPATAISGVFYNNKGSFSSEHPRDAMANAWLVRVKPIHNEKIGRATIGDSPNIRLPFFLRAAQPLLIERPVASSEQDMPAGWDFQGFSEAFLCRVITIDVAL